MVDKKQLTVLLSCLSIVLSASLLLLQLQGILFLKLIQQQRYLQRLQSEAITSRNTALARYRITKRRYTVLIFFIYFIYLTLF